MVLVSTMIGYDFLGLAHKLWPVSDTIDLFPSGSALGVFDTFFGDARRSVCRLLDTGKVGGLRVHLLWSTNHSMGSLSELKRRAPLWEAIAREYSSSSSSFKIYLSDTCEHHERDVRVVLRRLRVLQELVPSCQVVNCFDGVGASVKGVINENHTLSPIRGPYIKSTDGINSMDIDVRDYLLKNRRAEIAFLWGERFNLREAGVSPVSPERRTAFPSRVYQESIFALGVLPEPVVDSVFSNVLPIRGKRVYKSHSEDDAGDEIRENRPCLIVEGRGAIGEILSFNGRKLGEFVYGGPFQGGGYRYYIKDPIYGFELARKAKDSVGSPYVWVRISGKIYGPIHPTFRTGYFRKK